jgi:hypothetical protein
MNCVSYGFRNPVYCFYQKCLQQLFLLKSQISFPLETKLIYFQHHFYFKFSLKLHNSTNFIIFTKITALFCICVIYWEALDWCYSRHTDIQTYRHTDIQTYRHTDIQTYRHTDIQIYRHTDILVHVRISLLM